MSKRIKRLRIFAGPNGSGKSTLYDYLLNANYFNQYYHVNPDFLFRELQFVLNLTLWPFKVEPDDLIDFLSSSTFQNFSEIAFTDMIQVKSGSIYLSEPVTGSIDYLSAALGDYIRSRMLLSNSSFSFESVFSHPSKVEFIKKAKDVGFKVYLYFIATEDPLVNLERVRNRASLGGHDVPDEKVQSRYFRTMDNLYDGATMADRVFFFDNSLEYSEGTFKLFAEKKNDRLLIPGDDTPEWFNKYMIEKI